jgi:hypothetical protein
MDGRSLAIKEKGSGWTDSEKEEEEKEKEKEKEKKKKKKRQAIILSSEEAEGIRPANPVFITPEGKDTRLFCGFGNHNWVHQKHIAALRIQARWFSYILRKVRSPAPAGVFGDVAYAAKKKRKMRKKKKKEASRNREEEEEEEEELKTRRANAPARLFK